MKRVVSCLATLGLMALTLPATGGSVVAPNAMESTPGNGGLNTITRNSGNPRTYQMMFDETELTGIPSNSLITGVSFRIFGTFGPWPPAGGANWTDYNMWVSTPTTDVGTMSTTFADNVGSNVVQVMDGPFSIPEGSFGKGGGSGGTNAFGPAFNFTTPFLYEGGNLLFEVRHPGGTHTDGNGFLDGITTTHALYGVAGRAVSATGDAATTGAFATLYITQIHWEPVPAPSALALLGLAGFATSRRRRA